MVRDTILSMVRFSIVVLLIATIIDSYYHRGREPHRGGVGGDSGPRIVAVTAEEIEAYNAGYDYNEQFGDKKSWD